MATPQPAQDQVYLFRLQTLIIDGSTTVIRNIFDQKCSSVPLNVFLSQEKTAIKTLRTRNIITKAQFHLLYPQGGNPPSITDIDLTLATCLLRNLKSFGLNTNFNWSATLQPGDTSLEADLCRLRNTRNEIAHIASTAGINHTTFQNKWTEIEQVLHRLNTSVPNPVQNLQQNIDEYKNNPLDPEAEEKIKDEIKKLQKLEKDLDKELQIVKIQFEDVKGNVEKVKENIDEVKGRVEEVKESAEEKNQEVKENIKEVKENIEEVKESIEKVTKNIKEVKESTDEKNHEVKENIKEVKENIEEVKESVEKVKENIKKVKESAVEKNQEVKETFKQVKETIEEVKESVENVKDNIKEVKESTEEKYQEVKENIKEVKENVEEVKEDIAAAHRKIDEELKTRRKKADESEVAARKKPSIFRRLQEKIQMPGIKKALKEDLIVLYRKQYHTLPLSPLIEENDTPLIKFYVMPDINTVEHKRSLGGGSETKSKVTSLRDVFYKKGETCCEIYLSADAGFGKTAFSKRLVLTWCQAKKRIESEQKHFKGEDIRAMDEFKFVFLLSLRECSEECDIDEMIMKQIIPRLANTSVTLSNLETILCKEKCLVILDGLDEWSHPTFACKQGPSDIPHRKARECTILTTTRPWKLSVIGLSSSQIEQKLEIVGLNEKSACELKKSVISLLCDKPEEHVDLYDFNSAVKRKGLSVLETIPLLLMYLLCLFCDGIDLGRSKCELYCQIVELLLKRTFKKYPHMQHADKPPQSDIPQYFSEHIHCKNNYSLLKALAQLAYERLFNKHKENTLVFDQSVARQYLTQGYLDLCLFSGILTQSKQVTLTKQTSKVSFSHKSVQEYFCALYMSCQNESDVKKIVLQNCSSVQNILDMSAVFVFISGMNAKVMSSISRELMPVISEDKITRAYRSSIRDEYYGYPEPLKAIQNMYISCCKENPGNNDLKLLCQDFIIGKDCREESYFTNVKQLAIHNKNNMQSIHIWTGDFGVDCSLHEVIDSCGLADPFNIPKIFYCGKCTEEELCRLLNGQVECVTVLPPGDISCSSELCKTLQNNSLLRAIHIAGFRMSHGVMEQFVNCLNRKSMAEIRLRNLSCSTHGDRCPGLNLDLTQPSDLRTLVLDSVPVNQLEVDVTQLENCEVVRLPKPVTSLLRALPAASQLQTFKCSELESSGEVDMLVEILPKLVTLKHVQLYEINLGERSLSLSPEMVNIERVGLSCVTMAASTLHGLVKLAETRAHTVRVDIEWCAITPETEVEHVRQYLRTSPNFRITYDRGRGDNKYSLGFETIKC